MVMVCQKIQKIISQCTNRGPDILAFPWQVVDHKIIKTLQNFICKHMGDLENVQRSWEEKRRI
jgi:hypothetical protein